MEWSLYGVVAIWCGRYMGWSQYGVSALEVVDIWDGRHIGWSLYGVVAIWGCRNREVSAIEWCPLYEVSAIWSVLYMECPLYGVSSIWSDRNREVPSIWGVHYRGGRYMGWSPYGVVAI